MADDGLRAVMNFLKKDHYERAGHQALGSGKSGGLSVFHKRSDILIPEGNENGAKSADLISGKSPRPQDVRKSSASYFFEATA